MLYYTDYESNTTDLKVEFYGFEDCKPNQSYGPEVRDLFVLHFIRSGKGTFYVGENTYHLGEGDFFLLLPKVETYYQADSNDPWSYFWIGLNGNKIINYLQQSSLFNDMILRNLSKENIVKFDDKFSSIIDLMGLNNFNTYYHLSLFEKTYSLLRLLITVSPSNDNNQLTQKKKYVIQLKNYLDSNYSKEVTIAEIANKMALNRSYLSRIFKEEYDISPKNYLTHLRMEKAKQLLIDTEQSISSISEVSGYKDVLTFSAAFKLHTKYSPTHFRQTYDSKNQAIIRSNQ
ncbi:AraC family transcriptional regulator [Fundicoccus culcitae]|uniref:AraC family transcriptional regulator n=1 Tax=Fundicoccus culcitae TaxID=2969821 RepID=A0ABY5P8M7_9LACT|nr:AraC family transcriptional regulator [Fundicoccus culcitae]UUX35097.1 AraC family transcriptional regulator [Fundicoccus culcitae]